MNQIAEVSKQELSQVFHMVIKHFQWRWISSVVFTEKRLFSAVSFHCGESASNYTFKMLLKKVLSDISHSGILLNLF